MSIQRWFHPLASDDHEYEARPVVRYTPENGGQWHYDPQPEDHEPPCLPGATWFCLGYAAGLVTVAALAMLSYLMEF